MPDEDPYTREACPLLVVVSGPSGVGKDAAIDGLEEQGLPFYFVVTATSRPKREGEVDGRDYLFVTEEEFKRMIEQGELLEHSLVYGQYKGVPRAHVREALSSGLDVIMRLDVQGAAKVRSLLPDAVFVFLMPGSDEELASRLKARSSDSPDHLRKRLKEARQEMMEIDEFDYVVINREGQLDTTVEQLLAIITAEKLRVRQRDIRL